VASMFRLFFISLLIFSVLCMVPLMGSHHGVSHLHHDASTPCSTCMGTTAMLPVFVGLAFVGVALSMRALFPPAAPAHLPFHPPRSLF
jgi:hypothetical protein